MNTKRFGETSVRTLNICYLIIVAVACALLLTGCNKDTVSFNDVKIPEEEIKTQMALVKFQNPGTDYSKLSEAQQKEFRSYVLNNYVIQKIAIDDAVNKKNLVVSNGDLAAISKPFVTAYGSSQNVIAAAKKFGLTEAALEEFFFNEAMMNSYQQSLLSTTTPSKETLKAFYENNKDQFVTEDEVHAAHILVDSKEEADAIKKQLDDGADFAMLAKTKSTDKGSKNSGGDLGWSAPDIYVPEFATALTKMKKGEISEPVKTQFGYHIIKLIDTKKGRQMTLGGAKSAAASDGSSRTKLYDAWLKAERQTKYEERIMKLIKSVDLKWGSKSDEDAFNKALSSRIQ